MSFPVREVVCYNCGKTYIGPANTRYCSAECRAFVKKMQNKRKKKTAEIQSKVSGPFRGMTVSEVLRWIDQYKEKTGILVSYGKAVMLIEKEKAGAKV